MVHGRDQLGRPRLPYIIDPSAGSGSFLIEYMKLISATLGHPDITSELPTRVSESHRLWFGEQMGNVWAREFIFGIENNYDLGLAAKVNMVLHGDGSMNTWITSGLLPFKNYWVDGRNNLLGIGRDKPGSYDASVNEQFDFVISNPPFSLKMSDDEKNIVRGAFVHSSSLSEKLFVERWFQLLTPGGRFCCVLPEAILDTSTNARIRLFLLQYFRIEAIVSLPYDAFKPFTATKTCIVLATRRLEEDSERWSTVWSEVASRERNRTDLDILQETLEDLGCADEEVFMAEPTKIGYKRRKNLPDLPKPNELYREDSLGNVERDKLPSGIEPKTVLDVYRSSNRPTPSPGIGFWTSLRNVGTRPGFRLDPKYRWLWDFQEGVVLGAAELAKPLSTKLRIVSLPKLAKGDLEERTKLIDLEYVESRQAIIRNEVPEVDRIGSDKIRFQGCDFVISKLEPYLGKIIIDPPSDAIGSTEWIGMQLTEKYPLLVVVYLLMLPELREAYRRLQSGKRHARFDPTEMLDLRIEFPSDDSLESIRQFVEQNREKIFDLRQTEREVRNAIDELFQP